MCATSLAPTSSQSASCGLRATSSPEGGNLATRLRLHARIHSVGLCSRGCEATGDVQMTCRGVFLNHSSCHPAAQLVSAVAWQPHAGLLRIPSHAHTLPLRCPHQASPVRCILNTTMSEENTTVEMAPSSDAADAPAESPRPAQSAPAGADANESKVCTHFTLCLKRLRARPLVNHWQECGVPLVPVPAFHPHPPSNHRPTSP